MSTKEDGKVAALRGGSPMRRFFWLVGVVLVLALGGYGRRGRGGRGSDRSSRIERSCDRPLLAELGGQREPTRQVWQNFPFFGRLPRSRRRGEDSPCPWGQTNEQRSVAKGAVRVAFRAALLEWPLLSDLFSPLKSSLDSQTFDWSQDLSLSNWDSKDVVAILT